MKILTFYFVLLFLFFETNAHTTIKPKTINVFLDCSNGGNCHKDFIRQELQVVNFVRDRQDADVHVLSNIQYMESGAALQTLYFIGNKLFENKTDTISYKIATGIQENEERNLLLENLKIGLFQFIIKTEQALNIQLNYKKDDDNGSPKKESFEKDVWDYWVFQLGLNGSMDGNQNYFNAYGNGNINANRETNKNKTSINLNSDLSQQKYNDNGDVYSYTFKNYNVYFNYAYKFKEHWAFGVSSGYTNSLFSNYKFRVNVNPKIEYSYYPYNDYNTKRFVFFYDAGPLSQSYYDTTLFLKTKEFLFQHSFGSIASFTQAWGSVNIGAFWSNYLHDFSKNNLSLNGAISIKVARGLNFALWGNYNFVHDQINIRKGEATLDQLLVRNKELLSSYNYNLGMGISYRFGSKNNNAICPVFRGLNYSINL
ncbi:MAG: hypothetical protein KA275_01555 [Chitinophagaceae bacterium]|nr:hypothetical protein [Chitinophagaceae bacterium]